MLDDGTYDALVVDADDDGDTVVLELTLLDGEHRGELVAVRAVGLRRDAVDVLGLPATVVVREGRPTVRLDG